MNIREEIERATRDYMKKLPAAELDASLMVGKEEIALTLNIYGERVRGFPGSRETPKERSYFDVSEVTIGSGPDECSIYAALSEDDIEVLALKVEE